MGHIKSMRFRLALLAVTAVSLVAAQSIDGRQATARPILGEHPAGNVIYEFMEPANPVAEIAIDHVGAGLTVSGERMQGIVYDAGDGVTHLFDIEQDMYVDLALGRSRTMSLSGEAQASLRSAETGIEFDWEARATGEAACVEGDGSPAGCLVYEVDQVLSGNISGPDGRGTCGSLRQEITYIIVLDQDLEAEHAYVFGGFTNTPHGTGELRVSSEQCAASIYGVMPGDNIKLNSTARVSLEGTITEIGSQSLVAVVIIVGVMRDGTEFTGEGVANLRLRDGTAFGDIEGELFLAGSEAPLQFEGSLRLENVEIGKGTFTADGVLRFLPSETDGTGND